jgi:hypothetical protein
MVETSWLGQIFEREELREVKNSRWASECQQRNRITSYHWEFLTSDRRCTKHCQTRSSRNQYIIWGKQKGHDPEASYAIQQCYRQRHQEEIPWILRTDVVLYIPDTERRIIYRRQARLSVHWSTEKCIQYIGSSSGRFDR